MLAVAERRRSLGSIHRSWQQRRLAASRASRASPWRSGRSWSPRLASGGTAGWRTERTMHPFAKLAASGAATIARARCWPGGWGAARQSSSVSIAAWSTTLAGS